MIEARTASEARGHLIGQGGTQDGPYAHSYRYDQMGNMWYRVGWGGWFTPWLEQWPSYTNNRLTTNPWTQATMTYDAAGNLTNDGYQSYLYDATGQQTYASGTGLAQSYDGDRLRVKKVESSATTYYLRSTVLGGQVISELNSSGSLQRGYVYLGNQLLALQQSNQVSWVHQDPVTKSQRITNSSGAVTSTIDLDPWGGETLRSNNQAYQPHRYTSYERDGNGGDEAMMRRYAGKWHRFVQLDPSDDSYDLSDPQSFNRYAYVQNDPANYVDPLGLDGFEDLGAPPPVPTYVPPMPSGPLDTVVINHSEPGFGGGNIGGLIGGITIGLIIDSGIESPGGAAPQNPAGFNPQGTFDDAYKNCLGSLGKSMAPGLAQADRILDVANKTGVDPTLLAVTWRFESGFSFQPTNGKHTSATQTGDIGPGQLFPDIWDKSPYTDDLNGRKLDPFGTNRNVGQVFNGNAYDNLIVAGRALGGARGAQRAEAAGLYRAGASGNPGYKERVQNFKDNAKNYDAFFGCLAKKGFSP